MHTSLSFVLQVCLVGLCVVLFKVVQFGASCWRARRRFQASPVPGPQPASKIIGKLQDSVMLLNFSRSCSQLQDLVHAGSCTKDAAGFHTYLTIPSVSSSTKCALSSLWQDMCPRSWGQRMLGCSPSGPTPMARYTSCKYWTTSCWCSQTLPASCN